VKWCKPKLLDGSDCAEQSRDIISLPQTGVDRIAMRASSFVQKSIGIGSKRGFLFFEWRGVRAATIACYRCACFFKCTSGTASNAPATRLTKERERLR